MITKPEVRALCWPASARPRPDDLGRGRGLGVGGGGMRAVRRLGDRGRIGPAQCDKIRRNAERHHVRLRVHQGRAPEALIGLPPADAVRSHGGDHTVLATAIRLASPRTVVVTLAAVQRVGETATLLAGQGYRAEGVQLQASRLKPLPGGNHRLAAQNPVFVLWGQR
jgi:precorrin-6Y C5,15-methyltransferase (decarboxylating)